MSDALAAASPTIAEQSHCTRLERRVARERFARHEAERLLETKSRELYAANLELRQLNQHLEHRVSERTHELLHARTAAELALRIDSLTGIASRASYASQVQQAVERAAAGAAVVALILIDIDDFKTINDTLGHSYGDALLAVIAERLRRNVRTDDLVARLGGDEFAIVLEGHNEAEVARRARRLMRVFDHPVTVAGSTVQCSASFGVAFTPRDARSVDDLQRYADLALYKVKDKGGRGLATFAPEMLQALEQRQRIEADLKAAIRDDALDVWFQPIVDLKTGRPCMVEALARWRAPSGECVSPDIFIAIAERCGLIRTLGAQLLRKAMKAGKRWMAEGQIEGITVNVSPLELLDRNFRRGVLRVLEEEGFPGDRLTLEITEGVVLRDISAAREVMHSLRSKGVSFALDDFGSGYSNLAYLNDLPLSVLKIDRKLLVHVETDPAARAIIRNTVALCHDLGIASVCEGVETEGQLEFLRQVGCARAQGFLLHVPMPSEALPPLPWSAPA